jgi:hypothetical protein
VEIHVGEIEVDQVEKADQDQSLAEQARRESSVMFSEIRAIGQRLERLDSTLFQVVSSRFENSFSPLRSPSNEGNLNSAAVTVRRVSDRHLERSLSFASADLRAAHEFCRGSSGSDSALGCELETITM